MPPFRNELFVRFNGYRMVALTMVQQEKELLV